MKNTTRDQARAKKLLTLDQDLIADLEATDTADLVVGASKPTRTAVSLSSTTGY